MRGAGRGRWRRHRILRGLTRRWLCALRWRHLEGRRLRCPLPALPHHHIVGRRMLFRVALRGRPRPNGRRLRDRRLALWSRRARRHIPMRRWRRPGSIGRRRLHRPEIRPRWWNSRLAVRGLLLRRHGLGDRSRGRRRHRLRLLRRPRLNPLARIRQNIFRRSAHASRGRCWRPGLRLRPRSSRRRRPLQRTDRLFEGQTLHTQQIGSRALTVADDGCEHDRTIDLRSPPLPGCCGRRFENSFQIR